MSLDKQAIMTDDDQVIVHAFCSVTREPYAVFVSLEAWKKWKEGMLIQDAFPELTADQREFLISGATPAEWEAMYGEEE